MLKKDEICSSFRAGANGCALALPAFCSCLFPVAGVHGYFELLNMPVCGYIESKASMYAEIYSSKYIYVYIHTHIYTCVHVCVFVAKNVKVSACTTFPKVSGSPLPSS